MKKEREDSEKKHIDNLEELVEIRTKELRESEERFRNLANSLPQVISEADELGNLTFVNKNAYTVFGYTPDDFNKGLNALQMLIPEDRKRAMENIKKVLRGKKEERMGVNGYTALRKDGSTFPVIIYSSPIIYKDISVGTRSITIDITDKIKAEQKLKESEEKSRKQNVFLNNIMESLTHPFYVINVKDYTIALANSTASFEGLEHGQYCYSLTHNKNKPCEAPCMCPLNEVKNTKRACVVEHKHYDKEGNEQFYEIYGYPILDERGNVVQMIEYALNITDRKIAQQELKESEEKFRTAVKNSPDYILFVKRDGIIFEVNRLEKGFTREMVIGQNVFNEIFYETGDQIVSVRKAIGDSLKTGETTLYESSQRAPDGSITIYETRVSPFEYDNEDKIISFQMATRDITDKIKAEQKLKESEVWLSTTLNSIGDAVIATDNNGQITFLNPVLESLTDWKHDEAIGKPIEDVFNIVNEKTRERVESPVSRVLREGVVVGLANHTILIAKNGKEIPIADSGAPLIDDKGDTIGVVLVFRDITEQRKAEHIIEERVKELNCLYSISKIVEEEFIEINELLSQSVVFLPPAWQFPEVTCARIVVDGQEYKTENFKKTEWKQSSDIFVANKKIGLVEVYYLEKMPEFDEGPFLKEERHLLDALAERLGKDFERINAELIVRESEEKYRLLFENANDGISILDLEGNFYEVNNLYCTRLGYTREEILESNIRDIITPEYADLVSNRILDLREKGFNIFESAHKAKDGRIIPVEINSKRILYDNKPSILSIVRDITERKVAEQKLKESEENLRVSNENLKKTLEELESSNKELEQFAFVASHDLKEPLRMISSFAQLLEKRYKDKLDEDANDFIKFITEGVVRMQDLINNLLDYSKIGKSDREFEKIDLNDVLKDVFDNLRQKINETNAEMIYDSLPSIFADKNQLLQVFQNLISNAIKFRGTDPPLITISTRPDRKHWVFSIRDNGIGIDSKDFERIFIIFKRLHKTEKYEGTGIGLAICKKIVERHSGKIWVESEVGKGSTFYFSIPKEIYIKN